MLVENSAEANDFFTDASDDQEFLRIDLNQIWKNSRVAQDARTAGTMNGNSTGLSDSGVGPQSATLHAASDQIQQTTRPNTSSVNPPAPQPNTSYMSTPNTPGMPTNNGSEPPTTTGNVMSPEFSSSGPPTNVSNIAADDGTTHTAQPVTPLVNQTPVSSRPPLDTTAMPPNNGSGSSTVPTNDANLINQPAAPLTNDVLRSSGHQPSVSTPITPFPHSNGPGLNSSGISANNNSTPQFNEIPAPSAPPLGTSGSSPDNSFRPHTSPSNHTNYADQRSMPRADDVPGSSSYQPAASSSATPFSYSHVPMPQTSGVPSSHNFTPSSNECPASSRPPFDATRVAPNISSGQFTTPSNGPDHINQPAMPHTNRVPESFVHQPATSYSATPFSYSHVPMPQTSGVPSSHNFTPSSNECPASSRPPFDATRVAPNISSGQFTAPSNGPDHINQPAMPHTNGVPESFGHQSAASYSATPFSYSHGPMPHTSGVPSSYNSIPSFNECPTPSEPPLDTTRMAPNIGSGPFTAPPNGPNRINQPAEPHRHDVPGSFSHQPSVPSSTTSFPYSQVPMPNTSGTPSSHYSMPSFNEIPAPSGPPLDTPRMSHSDSWRPPISPNNGGNYTNQPFVPPADNVSRSSSHQPAVSSSATPFSYSHGPMPDTRGIPPSYNYRSSISTTNNINHSAQPFVSQPSTTSSFQNSSGSMPSNSSSFYKPFHSNSPHANFNQNPTGNQAFRSHGNYNELHTGPPVFTASVYGNDFDRNGNQIHETIQGNVVAANYSNQHLTENDNRNYAPINDSSYPSTNAPVTRFENSDYGVPRHDFPRNYSSYPSKGVNHSPVPSRNQYENNRRINPMMKNTSPDQSMPLVHANRAHGMASTHYNDYCDEFLNDITNQPRVTNQIGINRSALNQQRYPAAMLGARQYESAINEELRNMSNVPNRQHYYPDSINDFTSGDNSLMNFPANNSQNQWKISKNRGGNSRRNRAGQFLAVRNESFWKGVANRLMQQQLQNKNNFN